MEQVIMEAMLRRMEERDVLWDNQHGFTNGRTCLANIVAFCNGVTASMEKGRATDVI